MALDWRMVLGAWTQELKCKKESLIKELWVLLKVNIK